MPYVAFTAAVYLALIVGRLGLHDSNPTAFALIGREYADSTALPAGYLVRPGSGADGQFYLRLALEPFTRSQTDFGIGLDNPPYRQQRIMYPLVGWLLSRGDTTLAPIALIGINYVSVCALAALGVGLAKRMGRAPALGLLLPFYPGFVVSLVRDLTEPLAVCLLAGALLALSSKRVVISSLLLCAAPLTRETTALIPGCLLLVAVLERLRGRRCLTVPIVVPALPLVVFGLWQAYLRSQWGMLPLAAGGNNFGPPLAGLLQFSQVVPRWPNLIAVLRLVELVTWGLVAIAIGVNLRTAGIPSVVKLAWIGYGVLTLVLSNAVWQSDWHVLRALVEWHLLGLLVLLAVRDRLALLPLIGTVPIWILTAQQGMVD